MGNATATQLAAMRPAVVVRRSVGYLTGAGESAEAATAAATAVLDVSLMATATFGIAVVLVLASADDVRDRAAIAPILACVALCASIATIGARLGYRTVYSIAMLTAIGGWPILAIALPLRFADLGGQEIAATIAVAVIVAFALASILRPPLAVAVLAFVTTGVTASTSLSGWHPTTSLIVVSCAAVAGTFGIFGRFAIDRLMRTRRQIAYLMQRLAARETLETTAQSIASEIADAGCFDLVMVAAFFPGGSVRHLAHTSCLPGAIPLEPGQPIRSQRARMLTSRAFDEPWISDWEPNGDPTDFISQMYDAGLRTSLYVPFRHQGSPIGVLVVGYGQQSAALSLRRRSMLEHWRPSIVEAAALVGSLLAPQLAQHDERSDQAAAIRSLIHRRRFQAVFQPIVDLRYACVVGYEALTRFPDGERPDVLFETAARIGLGPELETATLEAAVADAPALQPAGAYLSVNVSPEFLLSGEPGRILAGLPRPLSLEVTEHVPIDDYEAIRMAVSSLGRGIRLAVDDAGAGFASLRHVLELRPDTVKLDIGIVRHIDADPARQALIAGMVHFAERGKFSLIAEGVETQEERETLLSLGVRFGQGYLFGRAEPVSRSHQDPAAVA